MSEVGECALRMSGEHIPGSRNARAKALGQAAAGVLQDNEEARVAGPEGKGERQRRGGRRWGSGPEEHQSD